MATAALICVVSGCNLFASPELRMVGAPGTSASSAINEVSYESPLTEGSIMLCVTSPSTATIDSVALTNPNGDPTGHIHVSSFALRPNPYFTGHAFIGDQATPLSEIGDGFDPSAVQQVTGVSPADIASPPDEIAAATSELAVEVTWSSGTYAGGRDLAVTYEMGGARKTALIPFGICLCAQTCPQGLGVDFD